MQGKHSAVLWLAFEWFYVIGSTRNRQLSSSSLIYKLVLEETRILQDSFV